MAVLDSNKIMRVAAKTGGLQELARKLSLAAEGLSVLRQQYSGDVATQSMLGDAVKELSLSAKMCESFLKRMRGDTGGLVT